MLSGQDPTAFEDAAHLTAFEALDDLAPTARIKEVERRLATCAAIVAELEARRLDALRQMQRERLNLAEIGRRIGLTRQQVHRLVSDAAPARNYALVRIADDDERTVEIGDEVTRAGVRYRVERVQRMEPDTPGGPTPWAVLARSSAEPGQPGAGTP